MKNPYSRRFRFFRSTALPAAFFVHFAASSAFAVPYYWDNDGATAGFGTATGTWTAPTTGNGTQGWSTDATGSTLPIDVTTTTSDTLNFGVSGTALAAGTITVSGTVDANKLVFAAATSGPFTLSGGTIALGGTSPSITNFRGGQIIESALTLNANTTIATNTSGTAITLNGAIGGSADLTFATNSVNLAGANTFFFLGAASNYSGNTTITTANSTAGRNNALTVRATVNNALPTTTVLTLDGFTGTGTGGRQVAYDLNGNNQTLAGLTNVVRTSRTQRILNEGGATRTLTINNTSPASSTFSGNINGTGISLVKSGTGTQILSSTNSYNGNTDISGGKLEGVVGGNCAASKVIISNTQGTFGVAVTDNTKTWTCKDLAPTAAGTIEFNFGAVAPSTTISPLTITDPALVTGVADFTAATPQIQVNVDTGLLPGTYPLMTWDAVSGTAPTTADLNVSNVASGTAASLDVVGNTLNLVISSTAVAIVKEDNALALNNGSSWVGGLAPATTEVAKWNNIVNSANTADLGIDTTWAGITIEDPTGLVTINGTNTLTLGAATVDIDMSAATADLRLNCPLALGAANTWNVAASQNLTLGGQVSGAFGITKLGDGTTILSSSANSYTGNTTVTAGTLRFGANNVIPHGAGGVAGNVVVNGTLDLNGRSDSINGLSGSGIIDNTAAGTSTLGVGNNSQTTTFSGVIQSTNGNINLTKTGNGTLTLTGANTFTGTVTINASTGILALGNTAPLDNVTGITIGGGSTLRPTVANAVVNAPINLGAAGTISTINAPNAVLGGTTSVPFTLGGVISGAGDLTLAGVEATNAYGAIILNEASDYTGATLLTTASTTDNNNANLFVRLGVTNALPVTTVLTLDGGDGTGGGRFCELNLFGNDQTLAGLTNVTGRSLRTQRITSTAAATLTINDSENLRTYSGQITGAISLVKSNVGTWTLSAAKAYTGSTTITGGTLSLGSSDVLPTTPVSIGGGTLSIGATFTDTVGTLTIPGAATINLGDADSALTFADSSGETWVGPLNLTGTFVSGASLRFGDGTGTGLTPAQLASISATGFTGFALDPSGFLTATPGGGGFASWITGSFTGGTIPVDRRGPNDDFDNDGISNLVEYAVDAQDPTVPDSSIGTYTGNTLSFTKRAGTSGLTYAIQDSTDLGIADAWAEVSGGSYVNDATTISFTLTPGTPARNFLRLQVVSN